MTFNTYDGDNVDADDYTKNKKKRGKSGEIPLGSVETQNSFFISGVVSPIIRRHGNIIAELLFSG